MRDALLVSALSLAPRNAAARWVGRVARSPFSRALTRAFVRVYGVDLSEAEGDLVDYPTLADLFTRRLKPGLRPVDAHPDAVCSPVDGTCAWSGRTDGGTLEIAPGRPLSLSALLAREVEGERDVVVCYLAPRDYHRVHVPREGTAIRWSYVPGTLWPVFPAAVRRVNGLLARNERVAVDVATSAGPMEVALVGAFGVGRISLELCDVVTNVKGGRPSAGPLDRELIRGAELGVFHLGSTVVVCTQPGRVAYEVRAGDVLRVGRRIGLARS
jgi:phosphatidylserine decarboxylase